MLSSSLTAVRAGTPAANVSAFNGTALNIDYPAYLSQHDVVYKIPPTEGAQALPIGEGDIGAAVWCPDGLRLQIQKGDLWADPPRHPVTDSPGPASNWQMPSAGTVSLLSDPLLLAAPRRFEQRLSLYSGVVHTSADAADGSCQITTFASMTAGVLVVHYQDQTLRNTQRHIEITPPRGAHLFAMNQTAGILQGFRDRRFALMARVAGRETVARMVNSHTARLVLEPSRCSEFTLYIAVMTSSRDGDPVAMAKSRIEAAMQKGYDILLREHKQHWGLFWQKSFLRLAGSGSDPLPSYLENLWYLSLYQIAACSRGFDAPLPNGALWLNAGKERAGPALYQGHDLRDILGALLPSNHLELTVPYVETCYRLLPELAARTGRDFGVGGARFPACFNRFGDEFTEEGVEALGRYGVQEETASASIESRQAKIENPTPQHPSASTPQRPDVVGDGLNTALLIWEAWRHAPDPFFLQERAYPLLRACATFALEYAATAPETLADPQTRSKLAAALRALIWASRELDTDEEARSEWEAEWKKLSAHAATFRPESLQPFGSLQPETGVNTLHRWLRRSPQQVSGLFAPESGCPDLTLSARLSAGLNSLLLCEEILQPGQWVNRPDNGPEGDSFGGVAPSALRVFPALAEDWNAAFTLAAPGGFRISSEAIGGQARYVAIKSLLGGVCRLINPWGAAMRARVFNGRTLLLDSGALILEFETQKGATYIVERADSPLSRAVRVRLGGRRSEGPKTLDNHTLGMGTTQEEAVELPEEISQVSQRLQRNRPSSTLTGTVTRS